MQVSSLLPPASLPHSLLPPPLASHVISLAASSSHVSLTRWHLNASTSCAPGRHECTTSRKHGSENEQQGGNRLLPQAPRRCQADLPCAQPVLFHSHFERAKAANVADEGGQNLSPQTVSGPALPRQTLRRLRLHRRRKCLRRWLTVLGAKWLKGIRSRNDARTGHNSRTNLSSVPPCRDHLQPRWPSQTSPNSCRVRRAPGLLLGNLGHANPEWIFSVFKNDLGPRNKKACRHKEEGGTH